MKSNAFDVMGKVAWLWARSPLHKKWPLSVFAINVIPAIQTNQFALLIKDELPVAFCSWASLDLECEVKYINDVTSLYAKDWMSGERKWFIDWIAPFGHNMELYKYMRKKYPYELFRAIRLDESSKTGKIAEFHGGGIDKKLASKIFRQYHHELMSEVKNRQDFNFNIEKEN